MKVLIWFVCILVYSVVVSALNLAGVGLGGVPVVLLAVLLIFLPAPALCRLLDRRRQQRASEPDSSSPARRPLLSIVRSRGFLIGCFAVVLILSFVSGCLVWREVEGQKIWDAAYIVGQNDGYGDGYSAGLDAGYDDGYSDGERADLEEITFYRNNAVLVTLGGEKYHRWGCPHVSGRSYLIYNVGLAELKGYTPCLDCWK